jgi:hypothetical protein
MGTSFRNLRSFGCCQRSQVVNQPFDERPQVEGSPLELDARVALHVGILFEDTIHEPFEVPDVAMESLQCALRLALAFPLLQEIFEQLGRERDGVQRSPKVMGDER